MSLRDNQVAPIRAHVHLAYGYDREVWARKFDEGDLLGLNERDPYGYARADGEDLITSYSRDQSENRVQRLTRLGVRAIAGFDFIHALRNREAILTSDVVWTHTESQHLAIALVFKLFGRRLAKRPKLVAQSVWLIDRWHKQWFWRRWSWRKLIAEADLLTFLSPVNSDLARKIFPDSRTSLVLFGINADVKHAPKPPRTGPLHLIAVGNDIHRDWATLIDAMRELPQDKLTIVSRTCDKSLVRGVANVEIVSVDSNAALQEIFKQADIAVVPLSSNSHASGITVMQEAALYGIPQITTKVGGVEAYFDDTMVAYVTPGAPDEIVSQINYLRSHPDERLQMALRSQSRMGPDGLSSESYAQQHAQLSASLLGRRADGGMTNSLG